MDKIDMERKAFETLEKRAQMPFESRNYIVSDEDECEFRTMDLRFEINHRKTFKKYWKYILSEESKKAIRENSDYLEFIKFYNIMSYKKYTVYYKDKNGELSHVWTDAEDENEAINIVKHEYWDAHEIVDVMEIK